MGFDFRMVWLAAEVIPFARVGVEVEKLRLVSVDVVVFVIVFANHDAGGADCFVGFDNNFSVFCFRAFNEGHQAGAVAGVVVFCTGHIA